jgi:solute carrier family 25 S-adenosylmethionine transporter 26
MQGVTMARDILWNGLSYAFFINWKAAFSKYMKRDSTGSENMLLGALGGSLAALFTQPLDVAKTRIMVS